MQDWRTEEHIPKVKLSYYNHVLRMHQNGFNWIITQPGFQKRRRPTSSRNVTSKETSGEKNWLKKNASDQPADWGWHLAKEEPSSSRDDSTPTVAAATATSMLGGCFVADAEHAAGPSNTRRQGRAYHRAPCLDVDYLTEQNKVRRAYCSKRNLHRLVLRPIRCCSPRQAATGKWLITYRGREELQIDPCGQ